MDLAADAATAPGGLVPFALAIDNTSAAAQGFGLRLALVRPDATQFALVPGAGLVLDAGGRLAVELAPRLPADAPRGTWALGAVLWQPGTGIVSRDLVTFEVR